MDPDRRFSRSGADRRAATLARMAIDPHGSDLKQFMADDPGGPVVMLNLLRFADGGRESYDTYARHLAMGLGR